mmetsp:Transcript_2917/g.5264  ORF Transcript_2917/g.5264 Transcript_2917/m.5264 type:complete len:223 (-) Transcript_2917:908-1576(-)
MWSCWRSIPSGCCHHCGIHQHGRGRRSCGCLRRLIVKTNLWLWARVLVQSDICPTATCIYSKVRSRKTAWLLVLSWTFTGHSCQTARSKVAPSAVLTTPSCSTHAETMQAETFEVAVVRAGLDLDGAVSSSVAILTFAFLGLHIAIAFFAALGKAAPCWGSTSWPSPASFTITSSLNALSTARTSWIWTLQFDRAFWTSPAHVAFTCAGYITSAVATAAALL